MTKSLPSRLRRFWLDVHLWIGVGLFVVLVPLGLSGAALVILSRHLAKPLAQAQADLQRAGISLSDTTIVAPRDGVVTRVEQLQIGSYVTPAQPVFWLVAGVPWVEANFKENQLGKMRIGQTVEIDVDAYSGQKFEGHVASFSPGTGSAFSPLPAQNATGNWVKVVQRLPVRIAFDSTPPEMAGRAGLSAHVKVDTDSPEKR